jgi:hypothetical protein
MARKAPEGSEKKRGKPKEGEGTQRSRLLGELEELLEAVDDEGLLFLVEQATILAHNARVDRLNRELDELRQKQAAGATEARAREGEPRAEAAPVSIQESEDGKVFILVLGGARKVMSREEMGRIVRVCHSAPDEQAGARQLHTVLLRERRDIIADAKVSGPASPLLAALYRELCSRYRPKEQGTA